MNKNTFFLGISVFFIPSSSYGMLFSVSDKEGRIAAHNYLDSFFERTFSENKQEFKQLPQKARSKVLGSCGDIKPLIFIAMMANDIQHEILGKICMFSDVNGGAKDSLCLQQLCTVPVGKILEFCNKKTRQAECFPIVLHNQHTLSPVSHMRINPDCARIMSDITRGKIITNNDLLVVHKNLPHDIADCLGLKDQCLSIDLSRSEKINLLVRSLGHGARAFSASCVPSVPMSFACLLCSMIGFAIILMDLCDVGKPVTDPVIPYPALFFVGVVIPVVGVSIITERYYRQHYPPVKTITFGHIKHLFHDV